MLNQFSRTELLFGKEAMERLAQSRVAVFGVGGVGGYAVEALVRSGVGAIDIIDEIYGSYTTAYQCLHGITAYSTDTKHGNSGLCQTLHGFLPK